MSHSLPESWRRIATDTSAVINLNATGCAVDVLANFPAPLAVPASVRAELQRAGARGRAVCGGLEALAHAGSARIVEVGTGAPIYESLIEGRARETLDDGEAATIAYAVAHGYSVLMDDRKARRICSERFPETPMLYTVELLLHRCVRKALGEPGQVEAVFRALRAARMRVPFKWVSRVVDLIGADRACLCPSLPRSIRDR